MSSITESAKTTAEPLDKPSAPIQHNPWATVLPSAPQEPTRGVRDIVGSPA